MKQIDARGKACPIPVILAKKETDQQTQEFTLQVDNNTAVENLKRFAKSTGYTAETEHADGLFRVTFNRKAAESECTDRQSMEFTAPWALFLGREGIGDGDPELGSSLMKMYLYTLCQEDALPGFILLMNGGVKIAVHHQQAINHLKDLEGRGVEILVCGTCLDFFGLQQNLQVGTISNMYDIEVAIKKATKVVTL